MIITVTANPCIDKTAKLATLEVGELNRLDEVTLDYSGKGANVSRVVKMLGGETLATGLMGRGGSAGFVADLEERGIPHRFVMVDGEVRVNLKVLDNGGRLTELNERGIPCDDATWLRLEDTLRGLAGADDLFILSGSLPPGTAADSYRRLCETLKAAGAKVLVDADGEALRLAMEVPPDYLKPNRFELLQYFGVAADEAEKLELRSLLGLCRRLVQKGVAMVALSLGSEGALFVDAAEAWFAPALGVEVFSPVGAGDSMVAAMAVGLQQNLPLRQIAVLATACSNASVTVRGTRPPAPAMVEHLQSQVVLAKIE